MSLLLTPLATLVVGLAVLLPLKAALPRTALIGASLVIGPCVLSLLLFALMQAGAPYGAPLLWILCAVATIVAAGSWRRAPAESQPLRAWIGPALIAAFVAFLLLLRVLETATPDGDGLFLFALKARGIHLTGEIGPLLRHPIMKIVHPDYPLHVPLMMCTGFLFDGELSGPGALAGGLMVFPGLLLFLGSIAAQQSVRCGFLVALLLAFVPAFHTFAVSGYADPALMALLAVAAILLLRCGPPGAVAGLACGLLPWIKHEGLIPFALLLLMAGLDAVRRKRFPATFLSVALLLGGVWRLSLLALDVPMPITEDLSGTGAWERLLEFGAGFGGVLVDPQGLFALMWIPVILACMLGVADRKAGSNRLSALVVLLCLLGLFLVTWMRGSAIQHIANGDIPQRLYLQILPLGIFVLATEMDRRFRPVR